jgi:lactoylglutathione lyase
MAKAAFPGGVQILEVAGKPQAAEFGFVTDDVAGAYEAAIAAGATAVSEPAEKPWGQTVAYVRDLNGMLVEFGTDI